MPLVTTELSISRLLLSVDEEVLKDAQYLLKLWSWHKTAIERELGYFRFRPSYEAPVRGNARAYWQYAIHSIIHQNRKRAFASIGKLVKKRQA